MTLANDLPGRRWADQQLERLVGSHDELRDKVSDMHAEIAGVKGSLKVLMWGLPIALALFGLGLKLSASVTPEKLAAAPAIVEPAYHEHPREMEDAFSLGREERAPAASVARSTTPGGADREDTQD